MTISSDGKLAARLATLADPQRPTGRVFPANFGVNAGHTLRSPLFAGGRFEFLAIPEDIAISGPTLGTCFAALGSSRFISPSLMATR